MSNEFEELLTFNAENYGEGGTEVPMDNLDIMESAVSHHMMDSPMDNSAGNLEQLGAETDPVASEEVPMALENPLPSPPPVEPMPQPPMEEPMQENVSVDALEEYMDSHAD